MFKTLAEDATLFAFLWIVMTMVHGSFMWLVMRSCDPRTSAACGTLVAVIGVGACMLTRANKEK
jgi:hypothetical protein